MYLDFKYYQVSFFLMKIRFTTKHLKICHEKDLKPDPRSILLPLYYFLIISITLYK